MSVTDFHIGAGDISINGEDIGHTTPNGVVITYEPNVHQHQSGQWGTTPVKASIIGINVSLEIEIAESTLDNLERVLPGITRAGGRIQIGGEAGREVVGKSLVLTPFDGTEAWSFYKVVPTSAVEVAYQVENERVYKVTFTALVDETAPEAENIGYVS